MLRRATRVIPFLAVLSLASAACTTARTTPIAVQKPLTPFKTNVDPSIFDENSANITNQWVPLTPGTQWIWEGQALDGEDVIKRRVVFTVTDLTKEIGGVMTRVGWDRDFNNGVLLEEEVIFLAQDKQGNIWHFGQYVELYDEAGELDGGRAWLAGYLDGAKAGYHMKANSKVGDTPYSQGYAPPPYYWDDFSRVIQTGAKACVKAGCYDDVLVIEEYEPTKPGASQIKYYAKGVGNIKVGWRGNDAEQEEMELIRKLTVPPEQLAQARERALKMEARAMVYGYTPAMKQRGTSGAS